MYETADRTTYIPETHHMSCHGRNHSDSGTRVACPGCGATVVRSHKGHLVTIGHSATGYRYSCWGAAHRCDPALAAWFRADRAADTLAGLPAVGYMAVVARGRKVAKGATGRVSRVTEGRYGDRVLLDVDGEDVWVDAKNVDPTADAVAHAAAVAVTYTAADTLRRAAEKAAADATVAAADERVTMYREAMQAWADASKVDPASEETKRLWDRAQTIVAAALD